MRLHMYSTHIHACMPVQTLLHAYGLLNKLRDVQSRYIGMQVCSRRVGVQACQCVDVQTGRCQHGGVQAFIQADQMCDVGSQAAPAAVSQGLKCLNLQACSSTARQFIRESIHIQGCVLVIRRLGNAYCSRIAQNYVELQFKLPIIT